MLKSFDTYSPGLPSLRLFFSFPMCLDQALIMLQRKLGGASVLIPCWKNSGSHE